MPREKREAKGFYSYCFLQSILLIEKIKKDAEASVFGGDSRSRTGDLMNAIHALYQLSYIPISFFQYITDEYFEARR